MSALTGRRLLVVVAHPDDETFGCGSVIAHAVAAGAVVTVCCATRGEAGELRDGCDLGGRSLGEQREVELHAAGGALGVADVIVLDYVDSDMAGDAAPDTLVGAPFERVVTDVRDVLELVDPDVVVTLDAAGGDGHRDHVRIAEATTAAVRSWGGGASLYYWCLVRSLFVQWLQALDPADTEAYRTQLGRPDADITTSIDVHEHLDARWAAIRLHASQHSPYDALSAELAVAFLGTDRLVRVEPPWTGGPLETALHVPTR